MWNDSDKLPRKIAHLNHSRYEYIYIYVYQRAYYASLLRDQGIPWPEKNSIKILLEEYQTIRGRALLCFTFSREIIRLTRTPVQRSHQWAGFQPLASHFSDRAKGWTDRYERERERESRVNGLHCTFKRPWLQPLHPRDLRHSTTCSNSTSFVSSPRPTLPFAIIQRWQTTVLSYESTHSSPPPSPSSPLSRVTCKDLNSRDHQRASNPLAGLQFLIFVRGR